MSSYAGVTFRGFVEGRRWFGPSVNSSTGPTRYTARVRVESDADISTLRGAVSVATFRRPLGLRAWSWVTQAGPGPSALVVPRSGNGESTFANAFLLSVASKGYTGKVGYFEVDLEFVLPEVV